MDITCVFKIRWLWRKLSCWLQMEILNWKRLITWIISAYYWPSVWHFCSFTVLLMTKFICVYAIFICLILLIFPEWLLFIPSIILCLLMKIIYLDYSGDCHLTVKMIFILLQITRLLIIVPLLLFILGVFW